MKRFLYTGAYALGLFTASAYAQVRTAKSERVFAKMVQNAPFAVVMLYDETKEIRKDRSVREQFDEMLRTFRASYAYSIDFKYADMAFIQVNISRRDNHVIADQYNITSYPTFLLFKDGHMVVDKTTKKRAQLTGFVTRSQLISFIDKHLKNDIKNAAKEGRKRRSYYSSGGPYFSVGVGYPYPYYAPYYGYPYYGYYGYPYYYGPGFGVGFGF